MNRIIHALKMLHAAMDDAGLKDHEYGLAITREAKMKIYFQIKAGDPAVSVGRPFAERDEIGGVRIIEFKEKNLG